MLKVPEWLEINIPKRPTIIVIDSATYLLMISSPDINKVAMSLYDVICSYLYLYQIDGSCWIIDTSTQTRIVINNETLQNWHVYIATSYITDGDPSLSRYV